MISANTVFIVGVVRKYNSSVYVVVNLSFMYFLHFEVIPINIIHSYAITIVSCHSVIMFAAFHWVYASLQDVLIIVNSPTCTYLHQ